MRKPPEDAAGHAGRMPPLSSFWLYVPTGAVLGSALAAGTWSRSAPSLAPAGVLPLSPELLGWALIGTLAALHRPSAVSGRPAVRRTGRATLGLGTMVLAPVIARLGAIPAVWVAGMVFLLAEACRILLEQWGRREAGSTDRGTAAPGWPEPARPVPAVAGTAHRGAGQGLGGPAGHGLWLRLAAPAGATLAAAILASTAGTAGAAVAGYVVGFAILYGIGQELERRVGGWSATRGSLVRWSPLALDVCGWMIGLALVSAAPRQDGSAGWGLAVFLAIAFAGLAAESARHLALRQLAEKRSERLERVQKAHARILGEASDLRGIAQQILSECRRVLPVQWFQLELVGAGGPPEASIPRPSWAAGPDGVLVEGRPDPPERPRALPGIHRRASWRIFEKALGAEGDVLATVRLWCDPRRVDTDAEELFASLVPQMSSSIHRAHLEREASLDPLTQVPLRRTLERRLANAYRWVCEEGGTMAVIMCDLDFFKSINDTYGHAAGDQALIAVARALEEHRREGDFCCRYGGEEFALLLEKVSGETALRLAERLRAAVEAIALVHEGREIALALSAGVAAFPELHVHAGGELLQLADEALYQAKEQGRNRCLLNAGQGRFRTVSGAEIRSAGASRPGMPRIFG